MVGNLSKSKGFKGDPGTALKFTDLSNQEKLELKGEAFTYEDFTEEQLANLKGEQGDKGDAFTYEDFTEEQLANLKGKQGDKGDTPSVVLEYDQETGELYYDSDGILLDKEYVGTQNYVTRADFEDLKSQLNLLANQVAPSPASITVYFDRWVKVKGTSSTWCQEVVVANADITPYSKVDLQLSAEQLAVFYEKDIALVTENDGGDIYVYCIGGGKPENTYVIQATVSEVLVNVE